MRLLLISCLIGVFQFLLASGDALYAQKSVSTDWFKLPDGFSAELIYDVPSEQGSWVAITVDPHGRLITSDQFGKLYRVRLNGSNPVQVEAIPVDIGNAQGLLCAFDSLYVMDSKKGLFRVRDTNGDDQYDSAELILKVSGAGEHGTHAIALSPDEQSLYICAGNHTKLPQLESSRVPQNWQEDQLLTRFPDAAGHANDRMAPGGWIAKIDPNGNSFELVSSGYRNQYDIAFDPNGELFTYDADMEWDVGLPWYRPTRVCHAVSGSEFGWRNGSGKWPPYYPDNLPAVVEIGPGSPTGIAFGTGSKFPAKYQNSLFIADWSYGLIYAVQLKPDGASYSGTFEKFCSAPALPVTDLVIHPQDGSMYFLIGGRRSSSAMYRVSYTGADSIKPPSYPSPDPLVGLRHELEELHLPEQLPSDSPYRDSQQLLEFSWKHLGHDDRFIRYAARIALEHQPVEQWAIRLTTETDRWTLIEGVVALARNGTPAYQKQAIEALKKIDFGDRDVSTSQRIALLRAYGLVLIRLGEPTEFTRDSVRQLASHFPAGHVDVNIELAKLLIAVDAPVTETIVELLTTAGPQEQQIAYVTMLTDADTGWTQELREKYFQWFLDAASIQGGKSLSEYVFNIRQAAVNRLTDTEKQALKQILDKEPEIRDPYADLKLRPLVKQWTMEDLKPLIDEFDSHPESSELESVADLENGKKMFAVAACYKCHRIEGSGGMVGPDLTPAGHRFSTHDLLEALIDPSKAVSDQYQATIFQLFDGRLVTGRVANLKGDSYRVQEDMASPGKLTTIKVDDIDEMKPSKLSMMPTGLLDNLTLDEIRDLVAYMKSTGAP